MKRAGGILLLVVVVLFVFGLKRLLDVRFASGDIYPPYSSLRADPLGTKALCESYGELVPTTRNYKSLFRFQEAAGTTLFLLGLGPDDFWVPEEELKQIEQLTKTGGRLVIGLVAQHEPHPGFAPPVVPAPPAPKGKKGGKRQTAPATNSPPANRRRPPFSLKPDDRIDLAEKWGFSFGWRKRDENSTNLPPAYLQAKAEAAPGLPEKISCHSVLYFDKPSSNWNVIYARTNDEAVVMERPLGRGSVVLTADAYQFSNEAMLKERHPALLAWAAGSSERILFDETHLGVEEKSGIGTLARKYRLHGVGLSILVLAALYIWKNSVSFLPPHDDEAEREQASVLRGKDSAAGFVNLLRRNLPARDLLPTCLEQWKKTGAYSLPMSKLHQVQAIIDRENEIEPSKRNPLQTYEDIRRALSHATRPPVKPALSPDANASPNS